MDRIVHFFQRRLGDSDAGGLLLGNRSKAPQEVDFPIPGCGDELHLYLLARTDWDKGVAQPRVGELHQELPVPGRSRRDSAAHPGDGGPVVCLLLALPAKDLFQAVSYFSTEAATAFETSRKKMPPSTDKGRFVNTTQINCVS